MKSHEIWEMDVKLKIKIIVHEKWSEIEVHVGINLFLIATDGLADHSILGLPSDPFPADSQRQ